MERQIKMTPDIKQIANTMGTEFAKAVEQAEANDAAQIESVMKSLNEAYTIYLDQVTEIKTKREELLNALADCFDKEHKAAIIYQDELLEQSSRLDMFRKVKLGQGETKP